MIEKKTDTIEVATAKAGFSRATGSPSIRRRPLAREGVLNFE